MFEHTPVSLKATDDALHIVWSDGVTHHLTWKMLRDACPCATCRDEREQRAASGGSASGSHLPTSSSANKPDLLPVLSLQEAQPLRVQKMKPVGNYAYDIDFSDGHNTGIYTLEHLRALGEQASQSGAQ